MAETLGPRLQRRACPTSHPLTHPPAAQARQETEVEKLGRPADPSRRPTPRTKPSRPRPTTPVAPRIEAKPNSPTQVWGTDRPHPERSNPRADSAGVTCAAPRPRQGSSGRRDSRVAGDLARALRGSERCVLGRPHAAATASISMSHRGSQIPVTITVRAGLCPRRWSLRTLVLASANSRSAR